MALRIPWDIEEAVLMLDMLLKSLDGKLTRKEAFVKSLKSCADAQ